MLEIALLIDLVVWILMETVTQTWATICLMNRPNGVTETAMDTAIIMGKALTWLIISHPMELNGMTPMAMVMAIIHMAHKEIGFQMTLVDGRIAIRMV